jgi:hypothetical protein
LWTVGVEAGNWVIGGFALPGLSGMIEAAGDKAPPSAAKASSKPQPPRSDLGRKVD